MGLFDDATDIEPVGTAKYTLTGIHIPRTAERPVVLVVQHAGRSNAGLLNANAKRAKRVDGGGDRTAELDAADLAFAPIFAKHVIIGWENVLDAAGGPVPYTPARGEELIAWLIEKKRPDIFAVLIAFTSDPDNFRAPQASSEDVGKR